MAINLNSQFSDIEEFVSNSSGIYIKFKGGGLMSVHQVSRQLKRTAQWGNMYETTEAADLGEFPCEFKDTPYIFLTLYGQSAMFEAVKDTTKSNAGKVYLLAPTYNESATYTIQVFAFGNQK